MAFKLFRRVFSLWRCEVKMEVICSYCRCHVAWKECACSDLEGLPPNPVSHGICPQCFEQEMAQIKTLSINKPNNK